MAGSRLWPFLKGYVIIRVTGTGLESWANRVARSGVPLWDVSRPLPDTLVARVRRADFARLRRLRGRRVRYRILGRSGRAVPVSKLARRWGLGLGAFAFLLSFYLATSMVWFVEIEAPPGLDPQAVRSAAAKAGLRPGQRRDRIDPYAVERRLHLDLPQVAWAHLELRGTRALLQVAERPGWQRDRAAYGHMVAGRDGVVLQVVALQGEPAVEIGEVVAQGQLLISGLVAPGAGGEAAGVEAGPMPYVRAEGQVFARVWYEEYGEAPLVVEERVPTGRRERFDIFAIGPYRWGTGAVRSRFQHYQEGTVVRRAWMDQGPLPLRWETGWREELAVNRSPRTVEEALAAAIDEAKGRIAARLGPDAQRVHEQVEVLSRGEAGGRVRVRVLVEARENIAVFEPIGVFLEDPPGAGAAPPAGPPLDSRP